LSAFSDNLTRYREQANISRKELAAILGVSVASVGFYETGRNEPDLQKLVKIATLLRVSIDDLLGYKVDTYEHYKAVFLAACPAYGIREQGDMVAIYSREQEESADAAPLTWESEFDFVDPTPAPHESYDFLPLEWTPDAPPYYLPLEMARADFIAVMQRAADDWKKETQNIYAMQIYKRLGMYNHTHKGRDAKKPADDTAGTKEG
jgi:transcriptional regulator with XRE-family HTH domain